MQGNKELGVSDRRFVDFPEGSPRAQRCGFQSLSNEGRVKRPAETLVRPHTKPSVAQP